METRLGKKRKIESKRKFFSILRTDDAEAMKRMLADGLDPNHHEPSGLSLLHMAAQFKSLDISKVLIENGALVNDTREYAKTTPLYMASGNNHLEFVKLLIDNGADETIGNHVGTTPFVEAAISKSYETVAYFSKKGCCANINTLLCVPYGIDTRMRHLLWNYVPLFMREQAIQTLLHLGYDHVILTREMSRAHISKIVTLDLLLARELCLASPFHRHCFPLDLFKIIFALCELPYSSEK